MYRIIGADGKEYGPIAAEIVRQWVNEGRANASTRIRLEGSTEWKTLADFPELMGTTAPPLGTPGMPPLTVPPGAPGTYDPAADAVSGPAIALIILGALNLLLGGAGILMNLAGQGGSMLRTPGAPPLPSWFSGGVGVAGGFISVIGAGFILYGGLQMKKLQSYSLCMAASIIAMIPCLSSCCVAGIAVGIWSLVVLSKPEVKAAFR